MGSCLSSDSGGSPKGRQPQDGVALSPAPQAAAGLPLVADPLTQEAPAALHEQRDSSAVANVESASKAGSAPSVGSPACSKPGEPAPATPPLAGVQLPSEVVKASPPVISNSPNDTRPKPVFGPPDSRMSVYSDTVEIEPVVDAMPSLPPNAQIPSASVTPAGNVLMHLNRATILRNRLGPGGAMPPLPPPKPARLGNPAPDADSASTASRQPPPSQGAPNTPSTAQPGSDSFMASAFAASVGSFGTEAAGDSGIFDGPTGGASSSNGPNGGGAGITGTSGPGTTSTSMNITAAASTPDSTGGAALLSGLSGNLNSAAGSAISAFTSGTSGGFNFAGPLHGLGVEATLSEMQQMALIGSGGGGCVYIGRWRGVTVAIKFIVSGNDDQLTRSQREALLSRLASHPHVVQTYATSVTQLTEQMFKPKEGAAGDALPGAMAAADPNISHDLLAGLTSGSWIRGELQMALHGTPAGGPAPPGFGGPTAGAPLPTIMETTRSSTGSATQSTQASGRMGPVRGLQDSMHYGLAQNDASAGMNCSGGPSGHTSAASSGTGGAQAPLLHAALNGGYAPPPISGGLGAGSSGATSSENPAVVDTLTDSGHPPNSSGGGSGSRRNGRYAAAGAAAEAAARGTDSGSGARAATAAAAAGGGGSDAEARAAGGGQQQQQQQPGAVADSFDASFVRDHLGRAKYSIHEVLRQLGAHEGQFLTMVVMEYCDGGSLLAALKEGPFHRDTTSWSPRMLLRSTVRTALEIAHGMQHLHLSGLVHGDLKPGNVLLKGSNQDKRKFVAKVSDLGIAHPLGSADEMAIDDGQIGSIAYMAPEVFRGRIMKASDVYSFGVLLWQMACGTGAAPYEGAHPIAIALGVSEGKMTLRWPVGVFRPLQQLGELCTQTDPAARPSFKSVVGALEKLERHMQRLAAAAGGGSGNSASVVSPASSLNVPLPAPTSGGISAGSPGNTATGITGPR